MPQPSTVKEPAELLPYLFATWPEIKKKQIKIWLKYQAVMVNGRAITQFNHPLQKGDVVSIRTDRHAVPKSVLGGGMKAWFEDAHLIVIDKPADLLSIASQGEQEKTAYFLLTDYLRHGDPKKKERVWIVHRLDRETSGLMVFAKTPEAKEALQQDWDAVDKRYEAVVEGKMPAQKGKLACYLDEQSPFKVYVSKQTEQTRHAVTHYEVLAEKGKRSLVRLKLETGRRHQIRVQLAHAGCPIIGDEKYGAKTDPARRLGLHACHLKFTHPITGEEMKFDSPLPKDLAKLV